MKYDNIHKLHFNAIVIDHITVPITVPQQLFLMHGRNYLRLKSHKHSASSCNTSIWLLFDQVLTIRYVTVGFPVGLSFTMSKTASVYALQNSHIFHIRYIFYQYGWYPTTGLFGWGLARWTHGDIFAIVISNTLVAQNSQNYRVIWPHQLNVKL